MWKVTVRGLLAHKVRLVATALAVLLGVAFVTGTNVLAGSVSTSFDRVFSDVYRDIDAVVRSSQGSVQRPEAGHAQIGGPLRGEARATVRSFCG